MNLAEKDLEYIWHPYTQMKNSAVPVPVVRGEGAYLYIEDGKKIIDAISSWWVNIHGHSHPYIAEKIFEQAKTLEQVIFAGFTHPKAVEIAERILTHLPENQKKVFFSDNGSTAVEVALKMAIQFWHNKGEKRNIIIALDGAYHGDTFGAMSVSGKSAFNAPFSELLFEVIHIPFPQDDKCLDVLRAILEKRGPEIAAFVFEPLIQGAAGMRIYSPETLNELIKICKENNLITIADEVMTGFGRTGKFFACDYIKEQPDIFCLSKGLTGGFMPMGLTTCTQEIYNAFLSEDKMKTFFHGHSYTANPLSCAAACASLDLMEKENTFLGIKMIENNHKQFAKIICEKFDKKIKDVRVIGTIIAIELQTEEDTSYFNSNRNVIYNYFIEKNILLRPLGNVIYILPPYCIAEDDLQIIYSAITRFLSEN